MAKAPTPEQIELPFMTEVVTAPEAGLVDWSRKITLRKLVWALSGEENIAADYASEPDLSLATPVSIESGLYIKAGDPRFADAEGIVTISSRHATEAAKQALKDERAGKQPKVPPINTGIIFPSDEFSVLGYYPKALARHQRTKTRRANRTNPDRDEAKEKVGRSAGHTLEGYIKGMNTLEGTLLDERAVLMSLYRDLTTPIWQARFKARNLDRRRKQADETIHNTAETASINLNLGTTAVEGLHRAIRANLYRRGTQDQLAENWLSYIVMTGRYAAARIDRLTSLVATAQEELTRYQPFLDRNPAE